MIAPESFGERLTELAWGLWRGLGVSRWSGQHERWAIDPEPLIIFTAALGDADPRLRDESTDWCLHFGRYVSGARLRNLLKLESPPARAAFGEYAATVNRHTGLSWPLAGIARPFEPTGRTRRADFGHPALISLRLRALLGVSARAEIVRSFVARPQAELTAADLAAEVSYTTRNVEKELDSLRLGGLVRRRVERGQLRYHLARPDQLLAFVGQRPDYFPRWSPIFRILLAGLDLTARVEDLDPMLRSVEARRTFRGLSRDLQWAELGEPEPATVGTEIWPAVERWLARTATDLVEARPDLFVRAGATLPQG